MKRADRALEIPERRIEGAAKVTGAARYAADVAPAGALWAAFVTSPFPHARVVSVDLSRARALPGVRAALAGADVRPARLGRRLMDWPVLAWDRVRFVGDRVAAVAADTPRQAEAAAAAVDVAYEELPAILDPEAALAPDAPPLHPDAAEERYLGAERPKTPHPNVHGYARHEHGDVDRAMAGAARVFEHVFEAARVFHGYLEPRAAAAWWEGETLRVVSTNKAPFALRDQLAAMLGIPAERIVVEADTIGGDFGGKGLSLDEFVLPFLARAAKRPVRAVMRYADEMRATNTRHAARIRLRTGVDAEGRIVAHEARALFDGGAYAAGKPAASLLPGEGQLTLAGYRVPSARVEALAVYTNAVPAGHMRAPAQPQNSFAAESHLDLIARALGVDPLELRLRNAIRDGEVDVLGRTWRRSPVPAVLERLRAELRPSAARAAGRGRGISLGVRHVGRGKTSLVLTATRAGRVEVLSGVTEQGGGQYTMLQRIVATELGVAPERVSVRHGSTAETPHDPGVGGSRVTSAAGGAARDGAAKIRAALEELAGTEVRDDASFAAAAKRLAAPLRVVAEHDASAIDEHNACAYAFEVAVDRETGAWEVTDALLVADVGTVISPVALRGQLEGGFAIGYGQARMEEVLVEDGRVTTANLGEYKLPATKDVPPLRLVLLTEPGPGPFGAKSVGELANPAVAPALANAIEDAVGVRVASLPLSAEKVFGALAR